MMKTVGEICNQEYLTVNCLDSVRKIQTLLGETGFPCCLVLDNGEITGILTSKDLILSHPNRIAADAVRAPVFTVNADTPLWQAQEIMSAKATEVLLVMQDGHPPCILTRTRLEMELVKYFDILTELHRSEYIYFHGAQLLESGKEISIIFIDIDNFGEIDKTYGHTNGDLILIEISGILKTQIPSNSYICRFGGDEFVILLPAYLPESTVLANHLTQAIALHRFPLNIPITISAGVVGGRRHHRITETPWSTITGLINLASLESTKAKRENSNISIATPLEVNDIA